MQERQYRKGQDDRVLGDEDRRLHADRRANPADCQEDHGCHVEAGNDPDDDTGKNSSRADDAQEIAAGQRDIADVDKKSDRDCEHADRKANRRCDRASNPDVRGTGVGTPTVQPRVADGDEEDDDPAGEHDQRRRQARDRQQRREGVRHAGGRPGACQRRDEVTAESDGPGQQTPSALLVSCLNH